MVTIGKYASVEYHPILLKFTCLFVGGFIIIISMLKICLKSYLFPFLQRTLMMNPVKMTGTSTKRNHRIDMTSQRYTLWKKYSFTSSFSPYILWYFYLSTTPIIFPLNTLNLPLQAEDKCGAIVAFLAFLGFALFWEWQKGESGGKGWGWCGRSWRARLFGSISPRSPDFSLLPLR